MATLNVLAVEPFYGGSHRRFLESALNHSRHHWKLITGLPVHWKWRMRSAPLVLAQETIDVVNDGFQPDVVFCTDMLDLPAWRGIVRDPELLLAPTAIYFHENQWTYPVAPQARVDHHYGYTNLLSAVAADLVIFNSQFHLDDFHAGCQEFLARMPDGVKAHDLERLANKATVIAPGFSPPVSLPPRSSNARSSNARSSNAPLTIGWVARWEHDKRPDRFEQLLEVVSSQGIDFQLILLGPRPKETCPALTRISERFADRISFNGFASSSDAYWQKLAEIDVVVSTADHEFFGIAICEAIWAGAVPVLPHRLSYPELVPPQCLYDSLDGAIQAIMSARDPKLRSAQSEACRKHIAHLQAKTTIAKLDEALERLITIPR